MNTPTISLAIISRKEDEKSLQKAVASVAQHVNEIVIVDTSEKGQIEGVDYAVLSLNSLPADQLLHQYSYKWTHNFAEARNFSFEQCTSDYIFWIDSDDIVKNSEQLPTLAKNMAEKGVDWAYMQYVYDQKEGVTHQKARLIKKDTAKWEKSVHEDLTPTKSVVQEYDKNLIDTPIVIVHEPGPNHGEPNAERNLGILMTEYERDGENTDPRTIMYIATTLLRLNKLEESLPFFQQFLLRSGSDEDKYFALKDMAVALKLLGRQKESINCGLEMTKLFPEWALGYHVIAEMYDDLEEYPKVIEWTRIGLGKQVPDTVKMIVKNEYERNPLGRLAHALLQTGEYDEALVLAEKLHTRYPNDETAITLYKKAKEVVALEEYVQSFMKVALAVRKKDRVKATRLFDIVPEELLNDIRIRHIKSLIVPPKVWGDKSIVIYCGQSLEPWAYPSIFSGIGGSEEAVINMSLELTKLGYTVTVYNNCGELKGTYEGVEYLPYYWFDARDSFDTLIAWRNPGVFASTLKAKKKYIWLHDIAYMTQFPEGAIEQVDKILFLSKWHRQNLPDVPDEKCFITNNGINPDHFKDDITKKPNSLIWSSSYDRGLLPFIKNILPLIRKEIPDVTLDVAYGWGNIDKEKHLVPELQQLRDELTPILENTEGIIHHGRLSHLRLAKLMGECLVYPYASEFGETCNITSMKAQAAGCAVITTSQAGGTQERVKFGRIVTGDGIYTDKKLQEQFAKEVVNSLKNPKKPIHIDTLNFSWKSTAKQWQEGLL